MSAPKTCWIEWNDDSEEAEFFHTAPTGGPKDVKYLCADLVCGDCALEYDEECPNYHPTEEGFVCPSGKNPACMAWEERGK